MHRIIADNVHGKPKMRIVSKKRPKPNLVVCTFTSLCFFAFMGWLTGHLVGWLLAWFLTQLIGLVLWLLYWFFKLMWRFFLKPLGRALLWFLENVDKSPSEIFCARKKKTSGF
jgi:protein-S-isoprenylcysteine O-methyltransferase Ste14